MKTTTLRPLADRILVLRDETPTTSGVIALAGNQPAPERGTVVAAGPGKRDKAGVIVPLSVAVGDIVIFGRYGGATIKSEIGPLLAMKEEDVLGVLEAELCITVQKSSAVGLSISEAAVADFLKAPEPLIEARGGFIKVVDKVLTGVVHV